MVSRVITCTIKPSHMDEFRTALNGEYLPRIQALPGFLENIESLDPATGKYCCLTVWKSPADVANYDSGLFREIAANLGPMMESAPVVETLPVENSSVHSVKAGVAAA